jgi:general secretion pathway protein A
MELLPRLNKIRNFSDRISLKYILNPLDIKETKAMIEFRLKQAGCNSGEMLFSDRAVDLIYQYTQGYPRRIANICHIALEELVMKEKLTVEEDLINEIIERDRKVGLD